jgi:hypothetical protein
MNTTGIIDATERTELIVPAKLEAAVIKSGIDASGALSLRNAFVGHFVTFSDLAEKAQMIRFDQPAEAKALRLQLKNVRTSAERTRKLLKEDSLRRGEAIDGINAVLLYELKPIEEAMDAIEKAEERAKASRAAALRDGRAEELRPFCNPTFYDLGNMPDEAYAALLDSMQTARRAKDEAAAKERADKVERDRIAAEAKAEKDLEDVAERERMRAENERLAQIAAEERAKREQQEAAARAERERADADARAAKELADSQAKAEREKREAAEKELARLAKERAEKIEAEEVAAKKAKAAPDREKLAALAAAIRGMAVPTLATEAGAALVLRINEQRAKFASWVESEAAKV